ncbi:UDP-glucose/GDP-mannose dehydrogenase family, central domain [seawater metagenome]|uniref:UDP-glucose/GDP-mannose dehydrogenase family, central domain n=1 Tax=seawater metagenome TaxID=1561972 RepID=A0A5E8CK21_9ZZZZ
MHIGIVGNGFVGQATALLKNPDLNVLIYDRDPKKCDPQNIKLDDLKKCSLIFVSVPTPMKDNGECYLGIVEEVINTLKKIIDYKKTDIILRSTVPPGTSEKLGVYFMPEFLTEKNWKNDFKNCENWIFGLKNIDNDEAFKKKIESLISLAFKYNMINYNSIKYVNTNEAEMIKYFRNVFLAIKVGVCNEIENFCNLSKINYDKIREIGCLDTRITESHTKVPGPDGKKGFGGTCFPKDINSLRYEMSKVGMEPIILESVIHRNNTIDRPNDKLEKGRAIV